MEVVCSICDEELFAKQAKALGCGHLFHSVCIDQWNASANMSRNTCPECRARIVQKKILFPNINPIQSPMGAVCDTLTALDGAFFAHGAQLTELNNAVARLPNQAENAVFIEKIIEIHANITKMRNQLLSAVNIVCAANEEIQMKDMELKAWQNEGEKMEAEILRLKKLKK